MNREMWWIGYNCSTR